MMWGVECTLDEVMVGIMEEITKNLDFYTHFMPSNCTPIMVKAKVLQYVTQKSIIMMLLISLLEQQ